MVAHFLGLPKKSLGPILKKGPATRKGFSEWVALQRDELLRHKSFMFKNRLMPGDLGFGQQRFFLADPNQSLDGGI